ncbi:MAG: alpha/beta hydrolase [bacterium]|nr:alpha/beta hydrolase [Candidatus Binatota bacterium]
MALMMLILGALSAWFTWNVYRPTYTGDKASALSFFAGWIVGELAPQHVALQALLAMMLVSGGALDSLFGNIGMLLLLGSWVALLKEWWGATETPALVESVLRRGLGADYRDTVPDDRRQAFDSEIRWKPVVRPFPIALPDVERVADIHYRRVRGINLRLDVYRSRSAPSNCPTLLQIHGGGWVIGSKNEQGLPLMQQMASRGWVCVSVDYRLSPHATYPDHLVDIKHAIAWIREHGADYGANPDFLVVTGGSAGGHLAALVALTANDPEYQPGIEDVDTSVAGCVPFYGVYDFTNRNANLYNQGLLKVLEEKVMKASIEEAPDEYRKASPLDRLHADAPPFFIIHGERDSLVPVEEARQFSSALEEASNEKVLYAEIPGAQHAFEIFPSLRSQAVIDAADRFLGWLYGSWLEARQDKSPAADVAHDSSSSEEPARVEARKSKTTKPKARKAGKAKADAANGGKGDEDPATDTLH